jgi:hypothetical protein
VSARGKAKERNGEERGERARKIVGKGDYEKEEGERERDERETMGKGERGKEKKERRENVRLR